MKKQAIALIAAATLATAALAHSGVKNPGVLARMDTMKSVGAGAGTLGDMAKGKIDFDPAKAEAARAQIIAALNQVPETFKEPHTDPKSEALPVIWEEFDSFLDKNSDAIAAVESMDLGDLDLLRGSMRALGGGCSGCHKAYKE